MAFDVVGTLFSLEAPRRELTDAGAPAHTLELWMGQTLRDYFGLSHSGQYTPLKQVLADALPRAMAAVGVDIDTERQDRILASFQRLDPAASARRACERLGEAGVDRLAVTNAGRDASVTLIERADMNGQIDKVISCDSIGVSKPHPDVYERVRREGEAPIWMVAAHGWDISGAAHAGLRTAWISSVEQIYLERAHPDPDLRAEHLAEAADAILGRAATGEDRHRPTRP
ncbi:MAG: HAD-IA family hydrolase [Bradymonadaceae bacterium]